MVHRVNLPYAVGSPQDPLAVLVGSKSGVALIEPTTGELLIPPGSSVEVDLWVFADSVIVTHNNPSLSKIDSYPTLEQFLSCWKTKRRLEQELGVQHGLILVNLKTHGGEEKIISTFIDAGMELCEFALLDQEMPANARILGSWENGVVAPLALRISAIEPLVGVIRAIEYTGGKVLPRAVFLDPLRFSASENRLGINQDEVERLYDLAPDIEFILCCPSRWGRAQDISSLALFLQSVGFKAPLVMTDIPLFEEWQKLLVCWKANEGLR
jgi:hypothetical protein